MKLHEQVKVLKELNTTANTGIKEIMDYLNSSKFYEDKNVNVTDILHRLNELENNLFFISCELS